MKDELTQEQKRVLIAEACGWKVCACHNANCKYMIPPGGDNWRAARTPPDFFSDLNAIQQAVVGSFPSSILKQAFIRHLHDQMYKEGTSDPKYGKFYTPANAADDSVFATAAQRAEAFGLTLNLWTP